MPWCRLPGSSMRRLLLSVVLSSGLASCGQQSATGLYLAQDANGMVTVQIVETDDHHITGRAEFAFVGPGGEMTDTSDAATGAVSEGTIALELKSEGLLEPSRSMSGSIKGDMLTLDGAGGGNHVHLVLSRASQAAVQDEENSLRDLAQSRRRAVQEAKQRIAEKKATDALIQQTVDVGLEDDAFVARVDHDLPVLRRVEEAFRAATAAMREKYQEERAMAAGWKATAQRSQLFVQANQFGIEANGVHIELEAKEQEVRTKLNDLKQRSSSLAQTCHKAHQPTPENPVPPGNEVFNTDCLLLLQDDARFGIAQAKISDAFATTEGVWMREKFLQDQIARAAQEATNGR